MEELILTSNKHWADFISHTGDRSNATYVSHLDDFILEHQPQVWIHGHLHTSMDYKIGETRVLCNARGYESNNPNPLFNPSLTIDV